MGAQGYTTIDFGAFPGKSDVSLAITGQASIVADSLVEAWLMPKATADHSIDEHCVESIRILAGSVVAGVGFTICAFNTSELFENPVGGIGGKGGQVGKGTRIYGQWTVAWVWN